MVSIRQASSPDEAIETGLKARAAGDIEAAREAFGAAVQAEPDNTRAKLLLADTLADQGELAEAESLYSAILKERPTHFRTLVGLADLHLQKDEKKEAEALLDQASGAAADDPKKLRRIGVAFRKVGRKDKAETALKAAAANGSGAFKERAEKALASLEGEAAEPSSRIQVLNAALSAKPEASDIKLRLATVLCRSEPEWNKRGTAQFAGGGVESSSAIGRAKILLREVLGGDAPAEQAEAMALLGEIARFEGQWPEALDWYRRAVEAKPGDAELQVEVGNALRDLSMLNEARAAYEQALATDARNVSALVALGDLEKLQDRKQEAADYYHRAAAIDPAAVNVATALRRLQASEAGFDWQDEIRRAVEVVSDPNSRRGFMAAANILLQYGLTGTLKGVLPRLEETPQGRQIAAAARELDRAGLSHTLDAKGTGLAGPDADLNEIRGFIEKPVANAETLAVIFSGGQSRLGGIEFSLMHRFIKQTGASAIYVRDIKENRYLQGIVGLGDDLDSTVRSLREKQKAVGAKRLMMIGTCRGVPGAMRYGLMAGAAAVLGIHPNIGAPGLEKLKPVDLARVEKFRAQYAQVKPLNDLYADASARPAVTLVYSEHNEPYTGRVHEFEGMPGITLVGISRTRHPIMRALLAASLLGPVLQEFIRHGALSPELADRVRNVAD